MSLQPHRLTHARAAPELIRNANGDRQHGPQQGRRGAFRINSVMVRWCGSVALHPSQRHLTLLGWRDVSAAAPLAARPRRTGINPERKWLQTARAAAGAAGGVPD